MLRFVRPWVMFLALAFVFVICASRAAAQSATSGEGSPESGGTANTAAPDQNATAGVVASEPAAAENELPPGTHREDFSRPGGQSPDLGPTPAQYLRIFVSLVVVIIIIWAISAVFRRFVTVRGLARSSESLKILYTLSLSPTRTLYLVRLADRVLLIGAGEGGLRTLGEITEPDEVAVILRDVEYKGNFDLNPFRDRLQSLMGEQKNNETDEDLGARQRKLKGTLDKLKGSGDRKP